MWNSVKGLFIGIALLASVAAAYRLSPAVRAGIATHSHSWLGWTAAARQADPVAFMDHVEAKLREEVGGIRQCRRGLAGELDQLDRKLRDIRTIRDEAQAAVEEFREGYQSARARDAFPITFRGERYSGEEAVAQVSLLLAEVEGFEATLSRLEEVQQVAQAKHEDLIVRENATEGYLAGLGTQRELARARGLTQGGDALMAQVDELLAANKQVVSQPVRSISELLAEADSSQEQSPSHLSAARQFLAAPTIQRSSARIRQRPISPASYEPSDDDQSPAQN